MKTKLFVLVATVTLLAAACATAPVGESKGLRSPLIAFPSVTRAADLIPEGWTVMEDVAPSDFDVGNLEYVSFLKKGETLIAGVEMRSRAVALRANFGLVDGQRLLAEQHKIPIEMRDSNIILAGVLLRRPDGYPHVASLVWRTDRWYIDFDGIGLPYGDICRLPRRK